MRSYNERSKRRKFDDDGNRRRGWGDNDAKGYRDDRDGRRPWGDRPQRGRWNDGPSGGGESPSVQRTNLPAVPFEKNFYNEVEHVEK